jgi:hypothetical protein
MGIDNKAFYPRRFQAIHCIRDYWSSADWQQRFWTFIGQRPEALAESGAENKGSFDGACYHR